ncbi:MAG: hypothetical protein ACE5G1_00305 [bacterium]
MKTLKRTFWPAIAAVVLMGLSLNFTACSNNSPLSVTEETFFAKQNMQVIDLGDAVASLNKGKLNVSQLVTPEEGGRLVLFHGDAFKEYTNEEEAQIAEEDSLDILSFGKKSGFFLSLNILPNSIKEPTKISLSMDKKSFDMQFGPHGTQFQTPALFNLIAVGLKLEKVNTETLDLYYDNPQTGQWERMETAIVRVSKERGALLIRNAQIPHFSRYAVAWSSR